MNQLTEAERYALAQLLLPNRRFLLTTMQQQAIAKVLEAKLLVHDEMEVSLAKAACDVVQAGKELGELQDKLKGALSKLTPEQRAQLTVVTECGCGHEHEPWHPKRGKCKQSLGGVKL